MIQTKGLFHHYAWILLVLYCTIGIVFPYIGALALICMFAPVIMAFFRGRMWCGNYCPRGSFNDVILKRFNIKNTLPNFAKSLWVRNMFLILLLSAFSVQLVLAWGDFLAIGTVFVRMIVITTILTIILDIKFSYRTWCMICPMGTLAHYAAKIKPLKHNHRYVTIDSNNCINCKVCSKNCPMGIDLLQYKQHGKVLDTNCLKCNVCVEKCPKNSLSFS